MAIPIPPRLARGLSGTASRVLIALAWHADDAGVVARTGREIAGDANTGENVVRRAIYELVEAQCLEVEDRRREGNVYRLRFAKGAPQVSASQLELKPAGVPATGVASSAAPSPQSSNASESESGQLPPTVVVRPIISVPSNRADAGALSGPLFYAQRHSASARSPALDQAPARATANGVPPPHTPPSCDAPETARTAPSARAPQMTLEARAQVLSVQARALQLAEPSADDQAESRRLMRERGLSTQAARIIAAVVPLAYVRANLATVPAGRGANPAGVVAAALWRDDADWFAAENRRRARTAAVDLADDRRRVERETWQRVNEDATAAADAERAQLAHLTDADVVALLHAARDRMPPGAERDELHRLIYSRRRDPLRSPTLRQLAIQELQAHDVPHRVATGDVMAARPRGLRTVRFA